MHARRIRHLKEKLLPRTATKGRLRSALPARGAATFFNAVQGDMGDEVTYYSDTKMCPIRRAPSPPGRGSQSVGNSTHLADSSMSDATDVTFVTYATLSLGKIAGLAD